MEGIDGRIAAVERDLERGATFLTAEAVRVLGMAAEAYPSSDDWASRLAEVAERLADAKPSMAGLRNAVNRLLAQVLEIGATEGRRMAGKLAERLITEMHDATETAASNAAGDLPDVVTVATCSYSSAVLRVCLNAQALGKKVRVVVVEPSQEREAAGRRLYHDLAGQGFETLLKGDVADGGLEGVEVVLVGADAVPPSYVVNGSPSLALARAARGRVPFRVVCETVKFTSEVRIQPGYDQVPMALVEAIVAEDGPQMPDNVRRLIETSGPGLKKGDNKPILSLFACAHMTCH